MPGPRNVQAPGSDHESAIPILKRCPFCNEMYYGIRVNACFWCRQAQRAGEMPGPRRGKKDGEETPATK